MRRLVLFLALALGVDVVLLTFRIWDWEHGRIRGLILVALMGFAALFEWGPLSRLAAPDTETEAPLRQGAARRWSNLVVAGALVAFIIDVAIGVMSVVHTARTGDIRLDQGQNTYRAALLLLRRENPYGRGVLLDLEAFNIRLPQRVAAGVGPLDEERLSATLDRYWTTLDGGLLQTLLPSPPADSPEAQRETSILGYKYGPVLPLLAAPVVRWEGPSAIPLLNLVAFVGWIIVLYFMLAEYPMVVRSSVMLAILVQSELALNYLFFSASDVPVLGLTSLALLALKRGWLTVFGGALALAVGSKLFPAVLFLPLLAFARSWRAALVFTGLTIVLFVPWIVWDAASFGQNILLWPTLMQPDSTSWVFGAPVAAVRVIRLALLGVMAPLAWKLITDGTRQPFGTLALMNLCLVLAGSVFHNNYVPWFSPWLILMLAERITPCERRGFVA